MMQKAGLLLAALALSTCAPTPLAAQVRWEHPPPDCRLAEKRLDGNSVLGTWTMRRYEWHALTATASIVTAEAIHRAARLPRWASAVTAWALIGLAPHIVNGALRHVYPINPRDWGFDAFNAAAPVILWTGASGGTWQSKALAATTELGGYFSLACFASP